MNRRVSVIFCVKIGYQRGFLWVLLSAARYSEVEKMDNAAKKQIIQPTDDIEGRPDMERLERRAIGRVAFPSRGVLVVCDTQEVLHVGVRDLGPIGVGDRKSVV